MKETINQCIKNYKGRLACPKCGTEIQLLPHLDTGEWYAYKCLCHSPMGWGYVSDLTAFNGWTHLAKLEKMVASK